MIGVCENCKIEFDYLPSRQRGRFCSNSCRGESQNRMAVQEWLDGKIDARDASRQLREFVRRYILKRDGFKCVECGWDKVNVTTGTSPLEIDHIDGDFDNNSPENMRTICPNCHSLTANWKALNKGNGRDYRRKNE